MIANQKKWSLFSEGSEHIRKEIGDRERRRRKKKTEREGKDEDEEN